MPQTNKIINLDKEFVFRTSRSGGKGGQNVNKVSTKAELRFDVINSAILSEEQKRLVLEKLKNKISGNGILRIISQTERSQIKNKEIAIKKFYELLSVALYKPKKRKASKPTKEAKEKRLKEKKRRSEKKAYRGKSFF